MINLIQHEEFGSLRLAHFAPAGSDVVEFENWEYMEDRCVGEAFGAFTEFFRLEEEPGILRAVCLDLVELPRGVSEAIMRALGLPLQAGLSADTVTARLGGPDKVLSLVPDRQTYEFRCGPGQGYDVSCTVQETTGLVYVTVLAPTPRRLAVEDHEAEA